MLLLLHGRRVGGRGVMVQQRIFFLLRSVLRVFLFGDYWFLCSVGVCWSLLLTTGSSVQSGVCWSLLLTTGSSVQSGVCWSLFLTTGSSVQSGVCCSLFLTTGSSV